MPLNALLFIVLPAMVLGVLVYARIDIVYRKYTKMSARRSVTAAELARGMLDRGGASAVNIAKADARALTDYYDARTQTLVLSEPIHQGYSITAIGTATHKAGHALQHIDGHALQRFRTALLRVFAVVANASVPLAFAGWLLSLDMLAYAGMALYALAVLFHVVTLPAELNASARALNALEVGGGLTREEVPLAKKVLRAAATASVASALMSCLYGLRQLLSLLRGRPKS